MYKYKCKQCGKDFEDKKVRTRVFCSRKCLTNYMNIKTKCVNCGGVVCFKRSQLNFYPNRGKFCSMKCMYDFTKNHKEHKICKQSHGYLTQGKHYIHRRIVADSIKRTLKKGEQIHHIDLDKENNVLSNLYLCSNQTIHNKLHWTLNRLIKTLMREKIVCFKNGEYSLAEDYEKRIKKEVR